AAAEANRVVGRQAGLLGGRGDRRSRLLFGEMCRVEREAGDAGASLWQSDPLVQLHQLAQARERRARIALDLGRARAVAENESVRRGAVDQAKGHSGVGGVDERALTLDEEQLAASALAFDDQALSRASEEVGYHRVDGDPPARDRDPRLAGGDEDGFES